MILLWGPCGDGPLSAVEEALARRGARYFLADQHRALEIELEMEANTTVEGTLQLGSERVDLGEVRALYLRASESVRTPAIQAAGPGSAEWRHGVALDDAIVCFAEVSPSLVINRPSAMASNNSKPHQLDLIREAGFEVPETLVTTDPSCAQEFWRRHGSVIYKSVSGVRSIVSMLRPAHRQRLPDVANCPTQFQRWIPGVDWRVHVVGEEIFASEVRCDADDYRYAGRVGEAVEINAGEIPVEISDRCCAVAASLGLLVAGIDLRRTPDDRWVCFEVNPSPGFTFYEEATGQPIADALASLLAS